MPSNATDAPNVTLEQPSPEMTSVETITVEFLYLDREKCRRCRGTAKALSEAISHVAPLFEQIDVAIHRRDIHIQSERAARVNSLEISPTVRIDGQDIQPARFHSACDSSAALQETGAEDPIDCREWHYRNQRSSTPPVALFVEELLYSVVNATASRREDDYQLSSNVANCFDETESGPCVGSSAGCN